MIRLSANRIAGLFFLLLWVGCTSGSTPPPAPTFDPAAYRAGDFYAVPFPSALRVEAGLVQMDTLPALDQNVLLRNVLPLFMDRFDGFSPNGLIQFFRVPEPLTALPGTAATTTPTSPVLLVNVEPGSPDYGKPTLVEVRYSDRRDSFRPPGTLMILPLPGVPLRPDEHYAAIVRTSLVPADVGIQQGLADPDREPAARFDLLRPVLDALDIAPDEVALATVFRTADVTWAVREAAQVVHRLQPPDLVGFAELSSDLRCDPFESATWRTFRFEYDTPIFLKGQPPHFEPGSGVIERGADGQPVIQWFETIEAIVTVPDAAAPVSGYPLTIYLHGAGGDRFSFVRDGTACSMASRGIATLAIDFPQHGMRRPQPGWFPELLLINPENLPAAIDLEHQASIDMYTLTTVARALVIPSGTGSLSRPITFRRDTLGFIGHSQGTFAGVPFLAFDDEVTAVILSGSGGHFMTFLTDRLAEQSIDAEIFLGLEDAEAMGDALSVALGIPGETPDRFHFLSTIVQMISDPIDPVNYARYLIRETEHPHHIWQSAGLLDPFDPPGVNEALATALGLDIAAPMERTCNRLLLAGGRVLDPPVRGNIEVDGRRITAVNSQFAGGDHWVYLSEERARRQGSDFLADALLGDIPTVQPRCCE